MRKYGIMVLILLICISQIEARDDPWPRCRADCDPNDPNSGCCKANDVTLDRLFLTADTACTPNTATTVKLYGTFTVTNENGRYCPFSVIDIYAGNTLIEANHITWLGPLSNGGLNDPIDIELATVSYTCGQQFILKNIYVQWAASDQNTCPKACNPPAGNAYQQSKCYLDAGPIIVPPPLVAEFNYHNVCLDGKIHFSDQTTGGYTPYASWLWNFGDNSNHNGQNPPDHLYASAGKYTVTLTVTDDEGVADSIQHDVYVWAHPVAAFTYNQQCGFEVQFTDASTATQTAGMTSTITAWSWDFNNDGTEDSNLQNPEFTFPAAGTYPVKLIVTDSHGCTHSKTNNLIVNAAIAATATSNSPVCEGSIFQLTGGPDGMKSYSWTGPNGFTSNLQSPSVDHPATQADAGEYVLTTIDNIDDCQTTAKTHVTIQNRPEVSAGPDLHICETDETVSLTGSNDGGPASYLWMTSGTGYFTAPTSLSTDYYPSADDKMGHSLQIELTYEAATPCQDESSDIMTIFFEPLPQPWIEVAFPT